MRKISSLLLVLMMVLALMPLCAQADGAGISGVAWYDVNGDKMYVQGEKTLSGVYISLRDKATDEEIAHVTTGSNGRYSFENLKGGTYYLLVTLPASHQFVEPADGGSVMIPADGNRSVSFDITLAENEIAENVNIGGSKTVGHFRAYAFVDKNANGGRSSSDAMLKGVETELYYKYKDQWILVGTAESDAQGIVSYWSMTPGTYKLHVVLPGDYIIGPKGEKDNGWYNSIPPCDSNEGWSEELVIPKGNTLNIGIGAVETGSLKGDIWLDENMNGLRDKSEGGFEGVSLSLDSESAGVHREIISGTDGSYAFTRLLEGDYQLTVTVPQDKMFAMKGDSWISEGNAFTYTQTVTVVTGEEKKLNDIGVMDVTSLTVSFYNDLNANGIRDEGETAFAGAKISLLDENGNVLQKAVSDGNGDAVLPVLRGGMDKIMCELPAGQVFTVEGDENDFVSLSAVSSITAEFNVAHGKHTRLNAGVTQPAEISGCLFNDENVSSVLDNGEKGVSGFTVQAVDEQGRVCAEMKTDEEGNYRFDSLLPQKHLIRFLLTDAWVFSDYSGAGVETENQVIFQDALAGDTDWVELTPGKTVEHVDGGMFRSTTFSGSVLLDSGVASLRLSGGMERVFVQLLDESGLPVSDTTAAYTDENGAFYVKGALPGTYCLEYQLPEGGVFTSLESENGTYCTESFTVGTGEDLTFDTLSAVQTGTVSGILYHDSDVSGSYDENESVLSDVQILLVHNEMDLCYETRTLDSGEYIFESVRPGQYTMKVTLPEGYCFAEDASSPVASTTEASASAQLYIMPCEKLENRNIAVSFPASLAVSVYYDLLNNGMRDEDDMAAPNIVMTVKDKAGHHSYTVKTDRDGSVSVPALVPGEYEICVSLAADCIPSDSNPAVENGEDWVTEIFCADGAEEVADYPILRYASLSGAVRSMDGSLTGVSGRRIQLYFDGDILQETETDEKGEYAFEQLKPGAYSISCDLPDDSYRFARTVDTAEDAVSFITADVCVIEDKTGYSGEITVPMGKKVQEIDVRIGALGKLGDTAWLDENGNGLQDEGERNIPGIEIQLYQYGELIAETMTDEYGHYLITDLYPGYYTVQVTMPKELKTTEQRTDYPLVASVLPESEELTVMAENIRVPSASRNLACDFGFVLRQKNVYPDSLKTEPVTNWTDID